MIVVDIYLLKREGVVKQPAPAEFEVLVEAGVDEDGNTFDRVRLAEDSEPCPYGGPDCYSSFVVAPCQRYVMGRWPNGKTAFSEIDFTWSEVES